MNNFRDRIRILFIVDGLEFWGGERVFLRLANGLRNHFEVFVATIVEIFNIGSFRKWI